MKHASTLRLYRSWAALKGRARAPRRADIQPRLLGSVMLDFFTLRPGNLIFGYSGSRLRAVLARRLDDFPFSQVWQQKDRAAIGQLLDRIVTDCLPRFAIVGQANTGSNATKAEILLLPTIELTGEISLIGALCAASNWTSDADESFLTLGAVSMPEQAIYREMRENSALLPAPIRLRPRLVRATTAEFGGIPRNLKQ